MNEKSVLYIEDNFENRLLVKRTLEAEGYSVLEAVDGPSGLKVAAETQPDLILLDISLPEIDGYDLARRFADFPHGLENVGVIVQRCFPALPDGDPMWPVLKLPPGQKPDQMHPCRWRGIKDF